MKLLLVDNDSDTLLELRALCDNLGYDVLTVHCSALKDYRAEDFDLIVLSGGYWYDDELQHTEKYADELALIRESATPIIGICLGMQLMHVAFSGLVPLLDEAQSGAKEIMLTPQGMEALGLPEHITVHKNHTRGVITALQHFTVFGYSVGHLEMMRHTERPLLGVQFHPEIGEPQQNEKLMRALLRTVV